MNQRVLIIDDNDDIRGLLRHALETEGYDVTEASNGHVAIEKLAEIKDRCILLLDLMMPVMDGPTFLEWKSQQPKFKDIPVLILSAVQNPPNYVGVSGYLKKPVDLDEMYKAIGKLCH